MKCDSRASLLARTFTNPYLGRKPKAKVATPNILFFMDFFHQELIYFLDFQL
jgi:hypothetical protein